MCFKFKVVKFKPQKHLFIWKAEKYQCSCVSFVAYERLTQAHVSLFYAVILSLIRINYTICNEINPDWDETKTVKLFISLTFSQIFMLFLVQVVTESRHCQVEMRKKTFHTFNNRLWSIITIIISIAHPLDAHHELHQYAFPAMLNCNVFLLFAIKFIGLSMHRNEFGLQLFAYECKFKWYTNRKNWLYHHATIIQSQHHDSMHGFWSAPSLSKMQMHCYKTYMPSHCLFAWK